MSEVDAHSFTDPDGVEVFYRRWPHDEAKGVIVIAHGASEHSGRYDRFARVLNDHGYAVYAIDHRGHGRTAESAGRGRMGPGGGDRLLDDLHDLVERARAEAGGVPVTLFGHTMGSMIGQAYAGRYGDGLAGYVLSGCPGPRDGAAEMVAAMQAAVDSGMGDEPLDLLGQFNAAFEPARASDDWLSCDPDGMGANARELERRLRGAGLEVTARYYPDARHELLNETNRDEVHADVIEWLASVETAAP